MFSGAQAKDSNSLGSQPEETLIAVNPFDDQPNPGPQRMAPLNRRPVNANMIMMQQPMMHQPNMMQMMHQTQRPVMPNPGYMLSSQSLSGSISSLSGRIYPADQPMIFSTTNPNAPPIFPCGKCHKEIHDNDAAIMCESGCNFWYHQKCSGLIEEAFRMLQQEPCAEWVCDKCCHDKPIQWVKYK